MIIYKRIAITNIQGHAVGVIFAEQYHSELGNRLSEKYQGLDFIVIINMDKSISYRTVKDYVHLENDVVKIYGDGGGNIATKIEFQTWQGGEGWNDPRFLIGYCKKSPREVLEFVYKTHNIYYYKDIYRPVDHRFPNNVEGLVISEVKDLKIHGCSIEIIGCISDLDLSQAYNKNANRTKEVFNEAIEWSKKWHLSDLWKDSNLDVYNKKKNIIKEIESIILN